MPDGQWFDVASCAFGLDEASGLFLPIGREPTRRALKVEDQHEQPLTAAELSVVAMPLPAGAATAAKQLPDGHNVAVSNFPATQPISVAALPLPAGAATAAKQLPDGHNVAISNFPATQPISVAALPLPAGAATAAGVAALAPAFDTLLNFRASPGQELRADDVSGGDRYHGRANDGAATSAASWEVVRFYRDSGGNITRTRYRTGVAWDDRAAGWS
jgi:hypothetical protein